MNPHRGLPPMPLLSPTHSQGSSLLQVFGQQWKGSDETLRSWLDAKIEEDRRIAEEEKTKQEGLKLETRKIELEMMKEALRGGVTPSMVPFLFAGNISVNPRSVDWIRDQMTDYVQQHSQTALHELRRETRSISQAHRGSFDQAQLSQKAHQIMAPPAGPRDQQSFSQPPYQQQLSITAPPRMSSQQAPHHQQLPPQQQPAGPANPHSSGTAAQRSNLPRLSMNEVPPPHQQASFQVAPQQPTAQQQPSTQYPPSSTSETSAPQQPFIFFHHYVPPGQQGSSSGHRSSPPRHLESPFSHQSTSHLTGPEVASSPKKRKSTTTQPQQPPPPSVTSQPTPFSPIYSGAPTSRTRRGNSRPRSDSTSAVRGPDHYHRQSTRQRRSADSGYGAIGESLPSSQGSSAHEMSRPPTAPHPQTQSHFGTQEHNPPSRPPPQQHSSIQGLINPPSEQQNPLPPMQRPQEYSRPPSPGHHTYQHEEPHTQRGRLGSGGSNTGDDGARK